MRRSRVALTGGIATAAMATAAVIATAGSAQQTPSPTTLHIVSKAQKTVGFGATNRQPRQGDRFGFGDKVTGDDTGFDRGVCTFIGKNQPLCTVVLQLSKGTVTAAGLLGPRLNKTPFTITGGTGAYNGARGTALLTDVNSSTTNVDITLLP
jgi:hypothetical protein